MAQHNEKGNAGERLAIDFLKKKGYEILKTNWRFRKLEIDIIVEKNNEIIIVEVKTRSTDAFGTPETFVSRGQQKNLIRAANQFIEEKNIDKEVRFDIISVLLNQYQKKIEHLEGAFNTLG